MPRSIKSIFRALTNSTTSPEPTTPPNPPSALYRKISLGFLATGEPTIVHRQLTPTRPRVLSYSLEKAINDIATGAGGASPPTTNSTSASGDSSSKSSPPRPGDSTGMTSLESSQISKFKGASSPSSENKMASGDLLSPIAETVHNPSKSPVPDFVKFLCLAIRGP